MKWVPATPPSIDNALATSSRLLPPSWCISREGPLPRLPTSTSPSRLLPSPTSTPSWCISRKGPLPRLPTSELPRCLRPSSTGAPCWCISPKGPCQASLHRHAHVASGRLLPAHLLCASVGRGSATPPYIGSPTPTPVISHWGTQLVHIPGGAPATPPSLARPTPPAAVSYRRNPLLYLSGPGSKLS